MSDLAIPGIVGSAQPGDYIEAPSGQAGGSEFTRGQFAKLDTGDDDLVIVAGDENDANVYGICYKDERNGKALVYIGPTLKAPIASGAVAIGFGETIFLASTTTVTGPNEATANQKAIGTMLETIGGGALFLTHWFKDRTPADK